MDRIFVFAKIPSCHYVEAVYLNVEFYLQECVESLSVMCMSRVSLGSVVVMKLAVKNTNLCVHTLIPTQRRPLQTCVR